jgi:hypothetical protein
MNPGRIDSQSEKNFRGSQKNKGGCGRILRIRCQQAVTNPGNET